MKILVLCTGNSCRSQMAEGFFKTYDQRLQVFSAGTHPAGQVNPHAIKVMGEVGVDISAQTSDHVDKYINLPFDYVITVCDDANEKCPVFVGQVKHRLHIGFDDPADATGTEEEIMAVYRRVRDEIRETFDKFFKKEIINQL